MSYILDALRRADRERRLGETPAPELVLRRPASTQKRRWPWFLLAGALLVNAAVFALVFRPKSPEGSVEPVQTAGAGPPEAMSVGAPEPAVVSRNASPAPSPEGSGETATTSKPFVQSSATRGALEGPRTAVDEPHQVLPARRWGGETDIEGFETEERTGQADRHADSRPEEQTSSEAGRPGSEAHRVGSAAPSSGKQPRGAPDATPPSPAVVRAGETAGPREVAVPVPGSPISSAPEAAPLRQAGSVPVPPTDPAASGDRTGAATVEPPLPLVELPSDLRRDLGELEMNVHVYHEDPERRFVFINMRSHRIGDPVGADGVVLESITPEGAVLAYDGRRILLPLPR